MKGVVLAGGLGTRLLPLTKVTNKHLLPVYNKPMVYFPIEVLISAGIKEILIITGPENAGDFMKLLGSGKDFGAEFSYRIQDEAGGIAQALSLARGFVQEGEKVAVILGDNIFSKSAAKQIEKFNSEKFSAKIFLKEVEHSERFGVAQLSGSKIIAIEEKPKKPKSNYAVTGLYLYDSSVFKIIQALKPSSRGELEITEVNNEYIRRNEMSFDILGGAWSDAGTVESLYNAAAIAKKEESQRS
ncbi:MAG: sugar phosphate nucleotidyltransferase [Candidatus Micrarchaeota archaeon]